MLKKFVVLYKHSIFFFMLIYLNNERIRQLIIGREESIANDSKHP